MNNNKPIIMLWSDTSQRPLDVKIKDAADYYLKKYGRAPTECTIHPATLESFQPENGDTQAEQFIYGIPVKTSKTMLICDIHIGCSDKGGNGNAK